MKPHNKSTGLWGESYLKTVKKANLRLIPCVPWTSGFVIHQQESKLVYGHTEEEVKGQTDRIRNSNLDRRGVSRYIADQKGLYKIFEAQKIGAQNLNFPSWGSKSLKKAIKKLGRMISFLLLLSSSVGWVVKKVQKSVYVVIEWPIFFNIFETHPKICNRCFEILPLTLVGHFFSLT